MILTKVLGLSAFLTGSKKAKIAILAIEIGVLAYALLNKNEDKKKNKKNKKKVKNKKAKQLTDTPKLAVS